MRTRLAVRSSRMLVCGLLASLSLAGAAQEPELVDPCGDSHTGAQVDGEGAAVPVPRDGYLDIERAWFEQHLDGGNVEAVEVHLGLCGDVPGDGEEFANWAVSWGLGDGCHATVMTDTLVQLTVNPPLHEVRHRVVYREQCSVDGPTPLMDDTEVVFEVDLEDAVEIDGRRITWTLRPASLPPAAAATLTVDTTWHAPSAFAGDVPFLFARGERATVELGPRSDVAYGGQDVVLGSPDG